MGCLSGSFSVRMLEQTALRLLRPAPLDHLCPRDRWATSQLELTWYCKVTPLEPCAFLRVVRRPEVVGLTDVVVGGGEVVDKSV